MPSPLKQEKDKNPEIEITPEMLDAGFDVIWNQDGMSPTGVLFSYHDLAKKVYLAMVRSLGRTPDG